MREDAAAGEFRVVLCWDQDRFGRFDILDAGHYIRPFRQAGVSLVTVAQGLVDWDGLMGQFMYSAVQMGKAQYLRDLSRNVVRGQLAGAAKGVWQGGPAPYGYALEPIPDAPPRKDKKAPTHLVANPETAPVVRRIFQMLLDGYSTHDVASTLNTEGIPARNGGKWRFSNICKLVKKRVYLGEFRYGDSPEGRYHWASAGGVQTGANTRKGRHWRAETNPVIIPNSHEPLVSAADFKRVQEILKERTSNKSPYRPKGTPYRLAGLLRCGHCGGSMVGVKKTYPGSDGPTNRTYVCSSYQQSGTAVCKRHFIGEAVFTPILVRKLQDHFADVGELRELKAEIRRRCQPSKPTCSGAEVARLQGRIDKLSKQIDQGAENLLAAPADLTAVLTTKLQSWQKERDELRKQLQAHQRPQAGTVANVDEMVEAITGELQTLRESLNESDPGLLRAALKRLVSKVELWFDFKQTKYGDRIQAVPRRGLIHLRPDLQIVKLVSGGSTEG